MRILILNEEFTPDTHGYLISDIAKKLQSEGHHINYFACKSKKFFSEEKNNTDDLNAIKLKRFWVLRFFIQSRIIKFINMFLFPIQCLIYGLFLKKIDLIFCASSHILFLGNVGLILSKYHKSKFIYRIEDIHPHKIVFNSDTKLGKILFNSLLFLDKLNCENSDNIAVLSNDMKQTLEKRAVKDLNISVIPNLPRDISLKVNISSNSFLPKKKNIFRLVFAGNIGRYQGLDILIEAMTCLKNENIELIFIGEGERQDFLKRKAKTLLDKTIFFLGFHNIHSVHSLINSADMGIISLAEGIEKLSFPSKITTYLSLNCPLLTIANEGSELSKIVNRYNIGITSGTKNSMELSKKILECSRISNFKETFYSNINNIMNSYFSKKDILESWLKIIIK